MKKILFVSILSLGVFISKAQVTPVVDEHAGHNHAIEAKKAASEMKVVPTTSEKWSANPAVSAPAVLPETLALAETEFNFGKIPQGKPVTHIFEVSNTGTAAFKLDNVQASCGCTTPQWDKEKVIAPNEKSQITVGYNAAAEGPFSKSITITYNGTQSKVILIKGEVWKTPTTSAPTNEAVNDLKN